MRRRSAWKRGSERREAVDRRSSTPIQLDPPTDRFEPRAGRSPGPCDPGAYSHGLEDVPPVVGALAVPRRRLAAVVQRERECTGRGEALGGILRETAHQHRFEVGWYGLPGGGRRGRCGRNHTEPYRDRMPATAGPLGQYRPSPCTTVTDRPPPSVAWASRDLRYATVLP